VSARSFAVVGAGPSGATAAERLARAGFEVTLYEPKGAWEKPCGGGVTSKALRRYDYLLDDPAWPSQTIDRIKLVGPSRGELTLGLDRPFRVFSRARLNGLLLERARAAGAELVAEAVSGFAREEDGAWRVETKTGARRVDVLVGADGAGSVVRRDLAGRFRPTDVALTMGYNAPGGGATEAVIDFPADLTGYVWAFPRTDHTNFGIFSRLNERTAAELKALLHAFMDRHYGGRAPREEMSFYGAKVPMLTRESWRRTRATGDGWALVGDAAGFVDPITGEGIYFAIRSGELLAEAFAGGGGLEAYERAWFDDFGDDLEAGARHLDRFYRGSFFGAPVIDRAILFSGRHPGFRRVMKRALGGEQSYITLKRDLVRNALRFV
jgi:geranylgeranyl reductase family protein